MERKLVRLFLGSTGLQWDTEQHRIEKIDISVSRKKDEGFSWKG